MIALFALLIFAGVLVALLTVPKYLNNRGELKYRYTHYRHFKRLSAKQTACGLDSPGPWPLESYEDWRYVDCPTCIPHAPR